jgi:predicted site-specific integrase-resolvase
VSVQPAAEIKAALGVNPHTLRTWVERGKVRKVGHNRYDSDSVIAY